MTRARDTSSPPPEAPKAVYVVICRAGPLRGERMTTTVRKAADRECRRHLPGDECCVVTYLPETWT